MRLTIVGSGDAFGSGGRSNTCFLLETQKAVLLLDCGASAPVAMKGLDLDLNRIDGIVLSHLHAGGALNEHATPGAATVQVLDGHVRVRIGDEALDLPEGRLIAFDSGVRHSVEAIEDSTLLLTLAGR